MTVVGIWLASASSRRRELLVGCLSGCDLWFATSALLAQEQSPPTGLDVREMVDYIAAQKASSARLEAEMGRFNELTWKWLGTNPPPTDLPASADQVIIVVADTLVADPDEPLVALGQPEDELAAAAMLLRLSGRRHAVWSATRLIHPAAKVTTHCQQAVVEFVEMGESELSELLVSKSWLGKAGAYDLAGPAGKFAKLVNGDELSVLGFAPSAIEELLHRINARS